MSMSLWASLEGSTSCKPATGIDYKPSTYLPSSYLFSTYLPIYISQTYFLQNWLLSWNQILTQLRFIHNWVITGIQWMNALVGAGSLWPIYGRFCTIFHKFWYDGHPWTISKTILKTTACFGLFCLPGTLVLALCFFFSLPFLGTWQRVSSLPHFQG